MKRGLSVVFILLLMGAILLGACTEAQNGRSSDPPTPTAQILPTRETPKEVVVVTQVVTETAVPDSSRRRVFDSIRLENRVAETEHFDFYAEDDYFPPNLAAWSQQAEAAYDYVAGQLNASLAAGESIKVAFRPPVQDPCPPRGLALPERQIIIFADGETPEAQIIGVLAHEVGHVLHHHAFADQPSTSRALNEGLATWASRSYYNVWQGMASLDAGVRTFRENESYLPLQENFELHGIFPGDEARGDACLQRRDILYTEWAAFIGFLIEREGLETFRQLLDTAVTETDGAGPDATLIIHPPNYQSVYGLALNQLEYIWLNQINNTVQ